ncbi:MAG TPA: VWA domain-containing protein [Bryobacteraceae bacterium]|nr:VWA domain-containing protein [Bryobacteraceae bacterium]
MRGLAVLGLLLAALPVRAQDQTPVFRATSELVLVDVQVLHTKTREPAPLLQAGDFQVSEEGVSQRILQFSRDEFPLSAVLLFDLTDSVRGVLKRLAEGATTALEHFKANDEVAVMVYSGHATVVDGFTTDRARTVRAIAKAATMKSDEPAYFNEAVYQAAAELRHAATPANRRVIIWLTDNLPNVPYRKQDAAHTEVEAFRALHEEGVVVAPILMKSSLWAVLGPILQATEGPYKKSFPPGDARKYAELTGGQAVGLRGKRPEERLAQLIDELRARYTIGYRPSDPQPAGTFRKIRVELVPSGTLRPKEWIVVAREGYYRK